MKELSIEEKAKAYDEALEKFDVILNLSTVKESGTIFVDDVRKVFPELKESEDEKISKELINIISKELINIIKERLNSEDIAQPRFKVGDWIILNGFTLYVNELVHGYYRTISIGGFPNNYDWSIYNTARLWTIQDAKNGDVLACVGKYGQEIGIIKRYVGKYGGCDKCFEIYCFIDWEGVFRIGGYMGSKEIQPATKEQRDLLFQKMKKAGYEWDHVRMMIKRIKEKEK